MTSIYRTEMYKLQVG